MASWKDRKAREGTEGLFDVRMGCASSAWAHRELCCQSEPGFGWTPRNRVPCPWSTWRACSGGCCLPVPSTRLSRSTDLLPSPEMMGGPWKSAPACTCPSPTPLGGEPYPTMRSWPRGHHGVIPCRHRGLISMKNLSFYLSAGLQNFIFCILARANWFSNDLESLHIILSLSYEEIFYLPFELSIGLRCCVCLCVLGEEDF